MKVTIEMEPFTTVISQESVARFRAEVFVDEKSVAVSPVMGSIGRCQKWATKKIADIKSRMKVVA